MKKIGVLVTGGAGYIGSHVVVELIEEGFGVVILDNFENAESDVPQRLERIVGDEIRVVRGDVRNGTLVAETLKKSGIDIVVHLAGKKAVGESFSKPLDYYDANVGGAISLLEAMQSSNKPALVFSSSATVYAPSDRMLLSESADLGPINPYGRSKLMIEEIVSDAVISGDLTSAITLRYFNPVGAHPSAMIGEQPSNASNNLFPFIAQTAAGWRERVRVFGDDYPTPDGTGVRDYIHVVDLARGHVAAIRHLMGRSPQGKHSKVNLGTGTGYSVKEAIDAFSQACGFEVPHDIVGRRPGDVSTCVADPRLAAETLGWRAEMSLERMCCDHWAFQRTLRDRRPDDRV